MSALQPRNEPVLPEEFLGDRRQPWDRLDDEPIEDFAFFRAYRELGKARSIRRVGEATGMPFSSLQRLSSRNSWIARVESYDAECHRLALATLEGDQIEMRGRHAAIAAKLLEKAEKAAELADPRFMHPRDIPIWLDVAAKLERLSRGATDTKRIELTGKDGGPITVAQELTADQRRELLGAAAAELNKRIKQQAIEESIIDGEVVEDE